jgi:hypothetical protein
LVNPGCDVDRWADYHTDDVCWRLREFSGDPLLGMSAVLVAAFMSNLTVKQIHNQTGAKIKILRYELWPKDAHYIRPKYRDAVKQLGMMN